MANLISFSIEVCKFYYTWISCALTYFIPRKLRLKDLSDDIVLITGGASGFGLQMALKFAEFGSTLVIWDINEQFLSEAKELFDERGNKCYTFVCDVSNAKDIYAKAELVKKEVGNVTILVNNAGIADSKTLLNMNDEFAEQTIKVNTLAHFWTCKAFLPSMIKANKGHIVSIASLLGLNASPKVNDYCASKAAAVSLMESLYYEVKFAGHDNIKFTTVCPYHIDTGMFGGVEADFFNPLDPKLAAEEVVYAIRANEEFVIIPSYFKLLYFFKPFLPWKCLFMIMKYLGADDAISKFVGHNNNKMKIQ